MIMRWAYHSHNSTAQPKYQGAALPYPTEPVPHPPLVPLDIGSMATSAETGPTTLPTAKIGKGRHDPHIKKSVYEGCIRKRICF